MAAPRPSHLDEDDGLNVSPDDLGITAALLDGHEALEHAVKVRHAPQLLCDGTQDLFVLQEVTNHLLTSSNGRHVCAWAQELGAQKPCPTGCLGAVDAAKQALLLVPGTNVAGQWSCSVAPNHAHTMQSDE